MLLKGIAAISIAVSACLCYFKLLSGIQWIPITFVLSFIILLFCWALSCVVCTCFVDIHKPCRKQSRIFRFYVDCILDALPRLLRVNIHITGLEKLPQEAFLLVGNHRSAFDPILEMQAFRNYHMGFVAKKELFRIPVIGKLMHQSFCFALDRGDLREGIRVINEASAVIQSGEASVGIYPEGTRSKDGRLLPFHSGAFQIAKKAKCPIVVVVIQNTEIVQKHAPFKRTDVSIQVLATLDAEVVANMKTVQISERVHQIMEDALSANRT